MATRATRESWKWTPAGELVTVEYEDFFDDTEFHRLELGLIPVSMDDRWFAFMEGNRLYFHRSWTGEHVFSVDFEAGEGGHRISDAWTSQAPRPGIDEATMLRSVIRTLILGQDEEWRT